MKQTNFKLHKKIFRQFVECIAALAKIFSTGGVASSVISASEKLVYVDGLRLGVLLTYGHVDDLSEISSLSI